MIHVANLTKRYGKTLAVEGVSFDVGAKEVVGFLGPNGAGKSTTLRILAGYLGRTSGEVSIAGFDLDDDPHEAKRRVGYMAETVPLYPEMRVGEYLRFRAELKGVPRRERGPFVQEAMKRAHVDDVEGALIGTLSKGYRQRVGLADALVAKPPIYILDEPTAGLDPNQIRDVRALIRELGREHTVLLSTHILSEVEATCDRVIVIGKGKVLAVGPTADIKKQSGAAAVSIAVRGDAKAALEAVRVVPGVRDVSVRDEREGAAELVCTLAPGADPSSTSEALVEVVVGAGLKVREVRSVGGGLEEVFAELTHDGGGAS